MPSRPPAACAHHPHIKRPAGQRCPQCTADYEADRGNAAQRGYSGKQWEAARRATLQRDPICTCPGCYKCAGTQPSDDNERNEGCPRLSTDADHHPLTRSQLVAAGVPNPNDPEHLRGLCHQCHSRHTMVSHHHG